MKRNKQKFKHNKIKKKILYAIITSGLIITLLTSIIDIIYSIKQNNYSLNLIEKKSFQYYNQMIEDDVNVAASVMEYYYDMYKKGEITQKEAKQQAINAVKKMRYGKDNEGYFWIDNTKGILIGHPMIPEQEGINRINITDPNGVKLISKIIDSAVNGSNNGFVDFWWEKPEDVGTGKLSKKRSYSKLFEPWGYIISTGNYIDDIYASINSEKLYMENQLRNNLINKIIFSVISTIALVLVGILLSNMISKPIIKITENIGEDENGQIKIKYLDIHTKDEIGYLAVCINQITNQVKYFINNITDSIKILNNNSNKEDNLLSSIKDKIDNEAQEIAVVNDDINEAANSVEEINETLYQMQKAITDVAQKTEKTTVITSEISERTSNLKKSFLDSKEDMESVYNNVKKDVEIALKEIENVNEIKSLAEKIDGIAGQTNLISLNAAIQAASSGNNGKTFSVVADEIKKLSESTKDTVKNIQLIIDNVINTVNNLSGSTLKIIDFVDKNVLHEFNDMVKASDLYSNDAENINDMIMDLNAILEELTASSNEILDTSGIVSNNLKETAKFMNNIEVENKDIVDGIGKIKQNSADNLNKTSILKQSIEKFDI